MTQKAITHDARLFAALLQAARHHLPEIRAGSMFGSPALYRGRRMVGCVFGDAIGLKVPAELAKQAIADRRATRFQPMGRKPMREWIQCEPPVGGSLDLLHAAIDYAAG